MSVMLLAVPDVPPMKFIDEPQSGSPKAVGSSKLLVCNADGQPSPSYRWTRSDISRQPLEAGGDVEQVVDGGSSGTLRIKNVSRSDAGRYRCTALNGLGAVVSREAVVQVACKILLFLLSTCICAACN